MKEIDITNKKFGLLKAIRFDHKDKKRRYYWFFVCKCGKFKVIRKSHVVRGDCQSCGCLHFRTGKDFPTYRHGMSRSKFYRVYMKIIERCYSKNCKDYKQYGGRGIICEWKSFECFKKDMYPSFVISLKKNGKTNTTIDRINVNGNYSKKNCKWSTYKEQERNRTNTVYLTFKGKTLCVSEWAEILGVTTGFIHLRRYRGWSVQRILTI